MYHYVTRLVFWVFAISSSIARCMGCHFALFLSLQIISGTTDYDCLSTKEADVSSLWAFTPSLAFLLLSTALILSTHYRIKLFYKILKLDIFTVLLELTVVTSFIVCVPCWILESHHYIVWEIMVICLMVNYKNGCNVRIERNDRSVDLWKDERASVSQSAQCIIFPWMIFLPIRY